MGETTQLPRVDGKVVSRANGKVDEMTRIPSSHSDNTNPANKGGNREANLLYKNNFIVMKSMAQSKFKSSHVMLLCNMYNPYLSISL